VEGKALTQSLEVSYSLLFSDYFSCTKYKNNEMGRKNHTDGKTDK
jgi:hypothetical protein